MNQATEGLHPAVVQQAAKWMARLWSGDASADDQAGCERWRAAHPDHESAWTRLQVLDGKFARVQEPAARMALRQPGIAPRTSGNRRRALQLLGLVAAVGGTGYTLHGSDAWQMALSDHSSRTGEIREISLPDGTRIMLGTATAIDVRYDERERRVILHSGDILVTTAPDPAPRHRPFVVQGRQGRIEALGTRFTVRQETLAARVEVFEGAVLAGPAGGGRAPVRVEAGQGTVLFAGHAQQPAPGQAHAEAWSRGMLVVENMRVDAFLAELGRYRRGVLRCDPAVAGLQVTGVFPLRDTDRALLNLTLALPVDLVYRTGYWVTVQPR